MKKIVTHPSNIDALKLNMFGADSNWYRPVFGYDVVADHNIPATKASGKYRLPSGQVVAKADVRISTRFIDFGPEDVEYLVYAGVIEEHREMNFYIVDDFKFRMQMDVAPMMSRHVLLSMFA